MVLPKGIATRYFSDFGKTYAMATPEQTQKIWQLCFDEVVVEKGSSR